MDANILVAALCPDEFNEAADTFLSRLLAHDFQLWAPPHLLAEVSNVLARKLKEKVISEGHLKEASGILYSLPVVLMWKEDVHEKAMRFHREGLGSVYDGLYIAVACLKNIPLITHDKEILKKGKKVHPRIYALDEWLASP